MQLPSRLAELTFGWPFHPWLVDLEPDGTLVFHERDGRHAPAGEYFHESFARSPFLRLWWNAHRSHWHHTVEWQDELKVRQAAGTSRAEETAVFDREGTERVLRDAAARGALSPLPAHLWGVLRCPEDYAELRREADAGSARVAAGAIRSWRTCPARHGRRGRACRPAVPLPPAPACGEVSSIHGSRRPVRTSTGDAGDAGDQ